MIPLAYFALQDLYSVIYYSNTQKYDELNLSHMAGISEVCVRTQLRKAALCEFKIGMSHKCVSWGWANTSIQVIALPLCIAVAPTKQVKVQQSFGFWKK